MKKRNAGTFTQQQRKQPRVSQKKPCDLGSSCPYQEEFQHLMEFSHDCAPAPKPSSNFGRDTGIGNRLGGVIDRSMGEWGRGNIVGSDPTRRHPDSHVSEDDDKVLCQLCLKLIELADLEHHLQSHENSVNGLKREQDVQYEESVLQDIQKQSALELEKQEQKRKETEEKELKEFNEALAISKIAAAKAKRQEASMNLIPEPGRDCQDRKVTLRFTLGSGKKFTRTFRAEHSVQDAFIYLHSLEELEGKSVYLRNAINTLTIRSNETDTFLGLGIATNTSLLVVQVAQDDAADVTSAGTLMGERVVTSSTGIAGLKSLPHSTSSSSSNLQPQEHRQMNNHSPTITTAYSFPAEMAAGAIRPAAVEGGGQSADNAITLITPTSSLRKKPRRAPTTTTAADVVDLTFS